MDLLLDHYTILTLVLTGWCVVCGIMSRKTTDLGEFSRKDSLPLRGLCVLLVVCGHLVSRTGITFGFLQYFTWATPAVGIFMFMSGFGTAKSYLRNSKKYLDGYFAHTSRKLLLPLGLAMVAGTIILMLDGSFTFHKIASGYLHGKTLLCNHSWYVFELYAFAMGFLLLSKVTPRKYLPLAIFALALLMYVVMRWILHWQFFWYLSIFGFPLGFLFAYFEKEIRNVTANHGMAVYGVLATCSLLFFGVYALTGNDEFCTLPQTFIGLVAVMCSWILPLPPKGKVLYWLGMISFELYLVHGLVRNCVVKWGGAFLPDGTVRGLVIIAVSVLAGAAFHCLIKAIDSMICKSKS